MIEVKNVCRVENRGKKNETREYIDIFDVVESCLIRKYEDEQSELFDVMFSLKCVGRNFAEFETLEKAERFYNDLKFLIIEGSGSIDIKEYE